MYDRHIETQQNLVFINRIDYVEMDTSVLPSDVTFYCEFEGDWWIERKPFAGREKNACTPASTSTQSAQRCGHRRRASSGAPPEWQLARRQQNSQLRGTRPKPPNDLPVQPHEPVMRLVHGPLHHLRGLITVTVGAGPKLPT